MTNRSWCAAASPVLQDGPTRHLYAARELGAAAADERNVRGELRSARGEPGVQLEPRTVAESEVHGSRQRDYSVLPTVSSAR
jgi:hypothetical protein